MPFKPNPAALLVSISLLPGAAPLAGAAEIYRWVDEQGQVHYGNAVPEAQKLKAREIDLQGSERTAEQRLEAQARAQDESVRAEAMTQQRAKAAEARAAPSSSATHGRTTDKNITCEEQWRRYRESLACFAPYRLVNGAIRAEAFKKCAEVQQPALCP